MPRRGTIQGGGRALKNLAADSVCVLSFYRFGWPGEAGSQADLDGLRAAVERSCRELALKGTVSLAAEGVNAALCGRRGALDRFIRRHFRGVKANWSHASSACEHEECSQRVLLEALRAGSAFERLKVRVKEEIVGFGRPLASATPVGAHADAAAWDEMLADDDVQVLDVRNDYESAVGAFRGATLANTATFREFPAFVQRTLAADKQRPVAMYCTGGIRCEKASAYLIEQGFADVRQLDGGILKYLAETSDSAFAGECFVFDGRVTVNADLAAGNHCLCSGCGWPVSNEAATCPNCKTPP